MTPEEICRSLLARAVEDQLVFAEGEPAAEDLSGMVDCLRNLLGRTELAAATRDAREELIKLSHANPATKYALIGLANRLGRGLGDLTRSPRHSSPAESAGE